MTDRHERPIFLGESRVRVPGRGGHGELVTRDGERFYEIAGVNGMPPFFLSVVSGHDHWLFLSSTGGLTCGRRRPDNALFPYTTDDKIHDACETTGPKTVLLVERDGGVRLWQPFAAGPLVYEVERNLYKNLPGNKIVFEEINRDLALSFSYSWTTGKRFGFIRKSQLVNTGTAEARVDVLDGLRNLLPYGVECTAQASFSTLIDAYKQAESVDGICAAIYTLSSILTDRAEPSEALKATIVWAAGLDGAKTLLSEDQVGAFCAGERLRSETFSKGKRGAFFVQSPVAVPAGGGVSWYLLADIEQGPARAANLLEAIRQGVSFDAIEADIREGTCRLERLAGRADAFQKSSDDLVTGRHFSNVLANIMRGGVFPHGYRFPTEDFLDFVGGRNAPLREKAEAALAGHEEPLTLFSALEMADASGNGHLTRMVHEYLPLTFSRRHGDPSRPWNHFSIDVEKSDGSESLSYQGNWRDIFQNWEALAVSFPEYIESFIAKFVNASTADGYNPYRISRRGIDWEILDPGNSWSNIGYWGDHQVCYLLRLLELSRDYHPGLLAAWLTRDLFVYANVPYRIKAYPELLRDPRNTVEYDDRRARASAQRVAEIGSDGELLTLRDGSIYRVNLLEKLLVSALVRIGNLVPGGGIWMNTQRPEWNDANNALVGYGLSMVTLAHLRRFVVLLRQLVQEGPATRFEVSREVCELFEGVGAVLEGHADLLAGACSGEQRKSFMDAMGAVSDRYRTRVYRGLSGEKTPLAAKDVQAVISRVLQCLDHSIEAARRDDGLYHSYNLLRFRAGGYDVEPLDEMLEGQVAVLSSGYLDAASALALLDALRESRLFREDQNSYVLYPDRKLPSFLEKNVIPPPVVADDPWMQQELASGSTDYIERDTSGGVHFNGRFRNGDELRAALQSDPAVQADAADRLCDVYESVFTHRRFTGRSGSMYKYEGLGCIYWHMVSKLLLATVETLAAAADGGADAAVIESLCGHFLTIQDGIGVHKSPALYGAFPTDPYSHTPGFAGVQQPGLTGQVKEDVLTRLRQLGVRVSHGEVAFEPLALARGEFLRRPASWRYTVGGDERVEELPAGSLAFTLCGVPVVYRIAGSGRVQVFGSGETPTVLQGARLGIDLSRSLFRRDGSIRKLVIDIPEESLR